MQTSTEMVKPKFLAMAELKCLSCLDSVAEHILKLS